jgi:hypothetical protein
MSNVPSELIGWFQGRFKNEQQKRIKYRNPNERPKSPLSKVYVLLPAHIEVSKQHNKAVLTYLRAVVEDDPNHTYEYTMELVEDSHFFGIPQEITWTNVWFWQKQDDKHSQS